MGHRLSKIYTKTGDQGLTGLGDNSRVNKDDSRVEAFGTIDELNSWFGLIHSVLSSELNSLKEWITLIQHDLFDLGGELCIPGEVVLTEGYCQRLETQIDQLNAELPFLKEFILPGGCISASYTHITRTVCRRAERRLCQLNSSSTVNPHSIKYVNRLSDWLFVAARTIARTQGNGEVLWQQQLSQRN